MKKGRVSLRVFLFLLMGNILAFAQAPQVGLPILFVHGFCGDPQSFQNTESAVQSSLQSTYPQFYSASAQYWVFYNGQDVNFEVPNGTTTFTNVPASTRFFAVAFDDPTHSLVQDFDKGVIANISIFAKADELAHIIWKIKSITGAPRVIVVAHSMGGLVSRSYIEELGSGASPDPYFNDISTLVTIDTPHGGSTLAFLQKIDLGTCWSQDSLDKRQMYPSGGDSIIPELNYVTGGATALPPALKAYSIVSYWTISTPIGKLDGMDKGSDNVLLAGEQDLAFNLNNPSQNSKSSLVRVRNTFSALFDLCGTTDVLHSLNCTGDAGQTLTQIENELNLPAVMTQSVAITPSTASVVQGGSLQLSATTPSKQAAIWSLLEGQDAGSITASGVYMPGNTTGQFHVVAIDSVKSNNYGIATITVTSNGGSQVATTLPASSITAAAATLNGTVNPQGANGVAGFQWGTDPTLTSYNLTCNYNNWYNCPTVKNNFVTQSFASPLSQLASNTTYYFRMVFFDTDNNSYQYGAINSLKTKNPLVKSLTAASITAAAALINGSVNPQGANGFAGFLWGTDPKLISYNLSCAYNNWYNCPTVVNNFVAQSFAAPLSQLASNTTYYYRMVFFDSDNYSYQYGAIKSFKTMNPVVTTLPASSITAAAATVNGTVNPQGANGLAGFQWGTDPTLTSFNVSCAYNNWYNCPTVVNNFASQSFASTLPQLTSNTTYYFRMVFFDTDNNSYQYGVINSFTTSNPGVITSSASSITASAAALNGTVNPQGANGLAGFQWSTDPTLTSYNVSCAYNNWYNCPSVNNNFVTQSFASSLSQLASNTTYYFRMVFFDTDNNSYQYGAIKSFTTLNPAVTTLPASSVTASGATLNGMVNPEGANGNAGFQWSTDPTLTSYNLSCAYNNWYNCPAVAKNFSTQSFNSSLTGLASNTTYYFRMVFFDTDNNSYQYGAILYLTTNATLPQRVAGKPHQALILP